MKVLPREISKVFISYAREDKYIADGLYSLLRLNMFRPWMDKPPMPYAMDGILPGENWDMRIMKEIRSSNYIILLLSKTSVAKNGFVQREVRAALDKLNELPMDKISLIPILLDEMDIPEIKVGFQSLNQLHCLRCSREDPEVILSYLSAIDSRENGPQDRAEIEVYTSEQFIEQIGDNRTLRICCDKLGLSSITDVSNPKVFLRKEFNGNALIIRNCIDLQIEGSSKENLLYVEPTHVTVLTFWDCHSINLTGLSFGHWPEKGQCTGGVISLTTCTNVRIYKCDLFGCGADGLQMNRVVDFLMDQCTIRDCSYGILQGKDCIDLNFTECNFLNNQRFFGVDLENVNGAQFSSCVFRGNSSKEPLIALQSCSRVNFYSCKETANIYPQLRSDNLLLNSE